MLRELAGHSTFDVKLKNTKGRGAYRALVKVDGDKLEFVGVVDTHRSTSGGPNIKKWDSRWKDTSFRDRNYIKVFAVKKDNSGNVIGTQAMAVRRVDTLNMRSKRNILTHEAA
jgi:hypothetical protein